jgi:hypothetical protein
MLKIETLTPEERLRYLLRPTPRALHEASIGFGLSLKGSVDLVCREVDGSIAWQHHQDNLITDHGRRRWMENSFGGTNIVLSSSQETPDFRRNLLAGPADGVSIASGSATYSANTTTSVKTWTFTFPTPSAPRIIGTIGLGSINARVGLSALYCYLLLTPPKTQSTTQTLEAVYKVALNPIA